MISLALLNTPDKNIINLSPGASRVCEEIDLRGFPHDGPVLNPNMVVRIKICPEKYRKTVECSGFIIGEIHDMPPGGDVTSGVEERPDLQ